MKARAWWNNQVVAESDDVLVVEGRHYFPREDVREGVLQESQTETTHPERGELLYYHVIVDGRLNADAAWTVPEPEPGWQAIAGRIAFWHGIEVEPV